MGAAYKSSLVNCLVNSEVIGQNGCSSTGSGMYGAPTGESKSPLLNSSKKVLEACWVEDLRQLRVRVDQLQSMDGIRRHVAVISKAGYSCLVFTISRILHTPELGAATRAVKGFVCELMGMRAGNQPPRNLSIMLN